MSILKYKTRGQSSPNKKQKIYYAAHEKDFNVYFNEIEGEILSKYDVAIWYRDIEKEINIDNEQEHLSDLSQMNLFVIPVTSRLLTTPNYALDKEYKYAIEKHIPVLPIMVEDNLVDLFNEKFGEIQFLDKTSKDLTAISYEEKLKKYLDSIIIGDELTKKIKESFDSYIFLSYRKKDRIYAQELMKLIHSNEKFRDVAIWYDEFLTPGENFNNEIKEALNKSDLFTLVVTPNLVNEINYVMTTEYPEAKNAGKKIIPAELVATDKNELTSKYPEIPEVIDGRDINIISEKIIDNLKDVVSFENETDSEHLYLIGLAYLTGVDVEINHELSIELLTAAANDNQVEAIKKLISMYHNGEGVIRDYEEEIKWIEKLVEIRKKKYEETGLEEDASEFFWETIYLGHACEELHKFDKAKKIYLESLKISTELNIRHNFLFKENVSECYDRLGNIELKLGNLGKSRDYYLKSFEINKQINEETNTLESKSNLSSSYNNLANIEEEIGNLEKARDYYLKSLDIAEQIYKEANTYIFGWGLNLLYNSLGNIEQELGNLDKAKTYYLKSLEIAEKNIKEVISQKPRDVLSFCYNNLAYIEQNLGNLEKAKTYYLKSLDINEQICKEMNTLKSRSDLSKSYNNLGDIEQKLGNLEKAKAYYLKSLEIAEQIKEDETSIQFKIDLSMFYNNLGDIEQKLGNLEKSKTYYLKSLKIAEQINEITNTLESKRDLFSRYYVLMEIEEKMGNYDQSADYYVKELELDKQINEETGALEDLAISYYRLGNMEEKMGNLDEAKTYYLKSSEIFKHISEKVDTLESKYDLAISYDNLVRVELNLDNKDESKTYCLKKLEIIIEINEKIKTFESQKDLSENYYELGKIEEKLGNQEQAQMYYSKSLEIKECLEEELDLIDLDILADIEKSFDD